LTFEKRKRRLKAPFFYKCMKFLRQWLVNRMRRLGKELDVEEWRGYMTLTNGKNYKVIFKRDGEIRFILPKKR